MHYFQSSGVSLQYLFEDSNKENLIKKWVEKDFFVIPLENGANVPHSYDHYKALEFYNRKDLEKYIDSVRTVELKLLKSQ